MVLLLCGITAVVIVIDQITKYFAFECEQPFVLISGLLKIVHTKNDGIAFGLGGGLRYGALLWSVLSILTVVFLFFFYIKYTRRRLTDTMALALIMGGALGNVIDRIATNGKVLDFIHLIFINWPAFNIADTAIVIGVIIIVFTFVFDHTEEVGRKKPESSADLPGSETP